MVAGSLALSFALGCTWLVRCCNYADLKADTLKLCPLGQMQFVSDTIIFRFVNYIWGTLPVCLSKTRQLQCYKNFFECFFFFL